ncbi:MAG: VWA domain-containing protein [Desulfobacter sp.]|nr:MAG: VWA domain-containing protein [Desulfobacter sp.]
MKRFKFMAVLAIMALIALAGMASNSTAAGLLKPVDGGDSTLGMKSHRVDVTINNGFARTEVDQIFFNSGTRDLEAVYSFPVPKDASLSELSLWINGKEVVGEVLEKEQARKTYADQKARGNQAAVAEKNDYKTFDVKVYPVAANADTRIRLVYYQPLEIDLNVGRYVYPLEAGNVDEERIAFWETDTRVKERFSFHAALKSSFPVKDIRMPGYQNQAVITGPGAEGAGEEGETAAHDIRLDFPEGGSLDKDIVLYYRLDDTVPARVELVPFREAGEREGKFMLVITPGADLAPITAGADWTFVLDVSGSMGGSKISTLVAGVRKSIKKMTPDHRFRIITFNDRAREITRGFIPATPENVAKAAVLLDTVEAGGSTNLYDGLERAYGGLDADRINGIILVTDGVANVGPSTHAELLDLHRKHDCRLFTFVIGNSANQPLLGDLAEASGGFSMNISSHDDLIGRILQAKTKMVHQSLYDTRVRFKGENVTQLTPGDLGNLYQGQQIVIFGAYDSPGRVGVELSGRIDGREAVWTTQALLPETDTENPEIERLWAMSTIKDLMKTIRASGNPGELKEAVVDLATEYSLVTDYTSMVVLSEQEMEAAGIERKNAKRVEKERKAQAARAKAPAKDYRVSRDESAKPMFANKPSPGIGTGALGPLFLGLACLLRRFRSRK